MISMPESENILPDTKGKSFLMVVWILLTTPIKQRITKTFYFKLPNGLEIMIPKGFIHDGASIPRWMHFILRPFGILSPGGLPHDFGYRYQFLFLADGSRYMSGASQSEFDQLFLEVNNQVNGAPPINHLAWFTLRLVGWIVWLKHRRNNLQYL